MSAAGPGPAARDAVLAALGDGRRAAGPAGREEMRACLRRVITWPWPEDMHVAVMLCRSVYWHGGTIGGHR